MTAHPGLPRALAATFAGVLLLVAPIPLLGTLPVTASYDETSSTSSVSRFHWEAPADLNGSFAAVLRVEVSSGTTFCEMSMQALGSFDNRNPVSFWATVGGPTGSEYQWVWPVQAHAGDHVDTRDVTQVRRDEWGASSHVRGQFEDTFRVTIAGFGLGLWERNDPPVDTPLSIGLTCEDPVRISLEAGREGRSWNQGTLEGGVGYTVNLGPTSTVAPRSISVNDGLEVPFDASIVRFLSWHPLGDDFEGDLGLAHPGGSERWTLSPEKWGLMKHTGNAGTYRVTLDWMGRDYLRPPSGILLGLEPVDSLDEAV